MKWHRSAIGVSGLSGERKVTAAISRGLVACVSRPSLTVTRRPPVGVRSRGMYFATVPAVNPFRSSDPASRGLFALSGATGGKAVGGGEKKTAR
jgi:hypothetical protein